MSSFVKASGGITPNSADPGEEFPFLHTITVVDRVVSVDKPELVQNNIKTETVTLNLDSEWEGLSTVINIGNERPVSVIWSGEPVVIPAELMTTVGSLDVSVVGYGDDGGIRAVTKKATSIFNVVASGFVEGDEAVPDPTTLLGQLIQAAGNANQAADRFNQASEDIKGIGPAIEKVQASEANAKQSETNAASSAESASQSASTASTSAEAARTSETNAAASATAAQQAVDGFGLEVGATTTGDPGTDAAVEIEKTGTKYTASFTIPRGDVGPIPHDVTLVGNGTKSSPLGVGDLSSRYTPTTTTTALDKRVKALEMIDGTFINPISKSGDDADADLIARGKIYRVDRNWKNIPELFVGGYLFYGFAGFAYFQLLFGYSDAGGEAVYIRQGWARGIGGCQWRRLVKESQYQALEARVQALEAKLSN